MSSPTANFNNNNAAASIRSAASSIRSFDSHPSFRQRSMVMRRDDPDALQIPASGSSLMSNLSQRSAVSRQSSVLSRRQMEQLIVEEHVPQELFDDNASLLMEAPSLLKIDEDAVAVDTKAMTTATAATKIEYPTTHPRNVNGQYTVLAFVNRGSGGQMGEQVFTVLQKQLGADYVTDLAACRPPSNMPQDVLQPYALDPNVRLLVCGGDGTMGWIQSSIDIVWQRIRSEQAQSTESQKISNIDQLEATHFAMAMIPLGTGNDLSRTFDWGPKYSSKLVQHAPQAIQNASTHKSLDRWRCVVIPHQAVTEQDKDWIPDMLGTAKAAATTTNNATTNANDDKDDNKQQQDNSTEQQNGDATGLERDSIYQVPSAAAEAAKEKKNSNGQEQEQPEHDDDVLDGIFCNYFSIGFDAQVAFEFHKDRKAHPENYKSVTGNKSKYAVMGITHGTKAPKLSDRVTLLVSNSRDSSTQKAEWKPVPIPSNCRAIVLSNIPSYAGGTKLSNQGGDCQDGLMDVVFLTSVWHVALLSGVSSTLPFVRAKVAAQGSRICLETHQPLHCQVDGEPWHQGPATIHFKHFGQRAMLTKTTTTGGACGACSGASSSTGAVVETKTPTTNGTKPTGTVTKAEGEDQ